MKQASHHLWRDGTFSRILFQRERERTELTEFGGKLLGVKSLCLNCEMKTFLLGQF